MWRVVFVLMLCVQTAFAQLDKARIDTFKKESAPLQFAVKDAVNSLIPGPAGVMEDPRATYLEGYGVVISLQVSLEPTRNPFSSPKSPAEIRAIVTQRRKEVQGRLEALLKDRTMKLQSVRDGESITIALHLLNSNPADVPELPAQIQLTTKKVEPVQVVVQEF